MNHPHADPAAKTGGQARAGAPDYVQHQGLIDWVASIAALTKPVRARNTTACAPRWSPAARCAR